MRAYTLTQLRHRCAALLVALVGCLSLQGQCADAPSTTQPSCSQAVQVTQDGAAYVVDARCTVKAPLDIAFAVFSDYSHMTHYLPHLKTSEVLTQHGNVLQVRQLSTVRVGFLDMEVGAIREVTLEPPTKITAVGVRGNFKSLHSAVTFSAAGEDTQLHYHVTFEPDITVPLGLGAYFAKQQAAEQLAAMVAEIAVRARAMAGAKKPLP